MKEKEKIHSSVYEFGKIRELLAEGKLQDAASVSSEIVAQHSRNYSALINHAMVMLASMNVQEAIQFAVKAFEIDDTKVHPYVVISRAYIVMEDYIEARKYAVKANENWPDFGEPKLLIGITLSRTKNYFDAEKWLKESLDSGELTNNQAAEAEFHLGLALSGIEGREVEALRHSEKAIKYNPSNATYHMGVGNILAAQNEPQAAQDAFDRALKISPLMGAIYWNKSRSKKFKEEDRDFISDMQELYVNSEMANNDRVLLGFALAKAYRDLGDYESAVDCWNTANAVQKHKDKFHISIEKLKFSQHYAYFPFDSSFKVDDADYNRATPIFILGMPRSGTTLTEQIIGSHSSVTPLGELEYLSRLVQMALEKFGTLKSRDAILYVRHMYLSEIENHSVKTPYFTDKMPLNFRFIPIIVNAFPEAKIIHCNRDPMAVCFSNFSNYFSAEGMLFTCGQEEIATYYNLYVEYMKFVSQAFSTNIYELDYKALTESQVRETTALLDACGLSLEPLCLNFQESKRLISTASQRQVRKGMYTGSTEKWKKFGPWLGPMIDTLETS